MKHKHADLIKAWADGAEIEYQHSSGVWQLVTAPRWYFQDSYRIKKAEPNVVTWHALKPDLLVYDSCTDREFLHTLFAKALLRLEVNCNDPDNLVLVSATLENHENLHSKRR